MTFQSPCAKEIHLRREASHVCVSAELHALNYDLEPNYHT